MNKRTGKYEHIIGIDEVGRGPLAGPVAVGAVCIYAEHHKRVTKLFPVIKDSKKLTAKLRDEWHKRIFEAESLGYLSCAVSFVPPSVIDKKGLSHAIRSALTRALKIVDPVSIPNSDNTITAVITITTTLKAVSNTLIKVSSLFFSASFDKK